MKRETAIRRLRNRALAFFGMGLDDYLRTFTHKMEIAGVKYWSLNDNQSMQLAWHTLGCPTSLDEVKAVLPSLDNPYRGRPV